MRKSGGAAIPMKDERVEVLAGGYDWKEKGGRPIFQGAVLKFLEDLAEEIRTNQITAGNQEAQAFAFWLRRKHFRQCSAWKEKKKRMGVGMLFHIAPSNIPMLFAYSMAFGMMAGNGNIIRVSGRIQEKIQPFCRVLHQVMCRKEHEAIFKRNAVITYDKEECVTRELMLFCDGRMIWGGDETIKRFEAMEMKPGSVTMSFANRSSIGVFDVSWIMKTSREELEQTAYRFYNDTLLMDQNACSSPKVLFWIENETQAAEEAKKRWWEIFSDVSRQYDLTAWKAGEKFRQITEEIMEGKGIRAVNTYENYVYTAQLEAFPSHPEQYQGRFGCFYEYSIKELKELCQCLNRKIQTIVYAGIDSKQLAEEIIESGKKGGDRIVPVGMALELDFLWDGKDLVSGLSRIIDWK